MVCALVKRYTNMILGTFHIRAQRRITEHVYMPNIYGEPYYLIFIMLLGRHTCKKNASGLGLCIPNKYKSR